MKSHIIAPLIAATALVASCGDDRRDEAEDRIEEAAEQSAAAAGDTEVALGMTEWQLLDAEIVASDGAEIGDVERVMRDGSDQVDRLLVEIEDSDPDRYVIVPLEGLSAVARGDDSDIQSSMTRAEVEALPDADLSTMQ